MAVDVSSLAFSWHAQEVLLHWRPRAPRRCSNKVCILQMLVPHRLWPLVLTMGMFISYWSKVYNKCQFWISISQHRAWSWIWWRFTLITGVKSQHQTTRISNMRKKAMKKRNQQPELKYAGRQDLSRWLDKMKVWLLSISLVQRHGWDQKGGFGRELSKGELSKAELDKINGERQGVNKNCIDKQAAMEKLKLTQKPLLLAESPFVKYLYIGAINKGYWKSFHMSLLFEDVVDCLQVLYPDFDVVLLIDHSKGHGRKHDGAFNAMHMLHTYGGGQPIMRDSIITKTEWFLGPQVSK